MDKVCTKCNSAKPIDGFYKKSKGKYIASQCKECSRESLADYRSRNNEKIKQIAKESYQRHKDKRKAEAKVWSQNNPIKRKEIRDRRKQRLPEYSRIETVKKYGISLEDFESMLHKANNSCEICGQVFHERPMAKIDHCHTTNKVRGVLCSNCNTALGLLKESPELMTNMINYIKRTGHGETL